jgi:hypothetical protein
MLCAQEKEKRTHEFSRLRFGVDLGVEMFNGATSKHSNIRENQSYYSDPYYDDMYYCGYMYDSYNYTRYNLGVKSEYSLNHRIAAAAGLRFSVNKSKLGSDRNYFLWKTEENNTATNYVRINEIAQNNYYAGFPFELKFFPGKSDMFIRQYLKAGMLFNFLLATRNTVSFTDKSMEKYNDKIKEQIGKPSFLSGYFYLGLGVKVGRMNHPFGSIEVQLPLRMFKNKKLASFIEEPETGFGLQTTIYIPAGKAGKKKLSYTY